MSHRKSEPQCKTHSRLTPEISVVIKVEITAPIKVAKVRIDQAQWLGVSPPVAIMIQTLVEISTSWLYNFSLLIMHS